MDYELLADEVLIRMLKNSDEQAFEAIFNRYWERIYMAAYKKTRSKEIAEDLAQSLFAMLWEKRFSLQIEHLYSYISVGIKNKVINHINAEIIRNKFRKQKSSEFDAENVTDHEVILKDLQRTIQYALGQLPEKTRLIFQLSRFEKHSVREIAQQFKISEKAVEYHITQSSKALRIHLKDFLVFGIFLLLLENM